MNRPRRPPRSASAAPRRTAAARGARAAASAADSAVAAEAEAAARAAAPGERGLGERSPQRSYHRTMTVAFSEDGRDFVRRDWSSLVKADPSGTIFSTPDYLKLYWEEFGDDFGVLLAFVERDGEQIGTAAFEVLGSTIRFLGGTEVTDYLGPLAAPPDAETVAAQLIQGLAGRGGWEELDLRGLPEDGRWLGLLRTAADDAGLATEITDDKEPVAPFL